MKSIFSLCACAVFAQSAAFAAVPATDNPPPAVVTFDSQVTNPAGSQAPGEQYVFFGANAKPGDKEGENPAVNLVKLTDFSVTSRSWGRGPWFQPTLPHRIASK